jgi:hypothetical protein
LTLLFGAVGGRLGGDAERVTANGQFYFGSWKKSIPASLCAILIQHGNLSGQFCYHHGLLSGKARSAKYSPNRLTKFRAGILNWRDWKKIRNCLAASAESAIHTSLGQRPRIMAGRNGRAEGPTHKSLWIGPSALEQ